MTAARLSEYCPSTGIFSTRRITRIIVGMSSANYIVTSFLIAKAHTRNDPWINKIQWCHGNNNINS